MTKKAKLLLVLIFLSITIILLLFFISKPVVVKNENKTQKTEKVDLVKLETNYKQNVKIILTKYEETVSSTTLSEVKDVPKVKMATTSQDSQTRNNLINEISAFKNQLLDLKVPMNLKDLHLNLVLAFDKMENYLTNNDNKQYQESRNMIKLAKNNYQWLNQ